jgi:hypothetical protein
MAGSVNKVILVGNLGADPEIRRTQDGRPVANLRLATSDSWKDKATGERREKTEWHRVVIFNENLCRIAEQYLKKGSKVYIEGQLQTRKWWNRARTATRPGGAAGLPRRADCSTIRQRQREAAVISAPTMAGIGRPPSRKVAAAGVRRATAARAPTWTTRSF